MATCRLSSVPSTFVSTFRVNSIGISPVSICDRPRRTLLRICINDDKDDVENIGGVKIILDGEPVERENENEQSKTFLGLSPKQEVDSLDNGLSFAGPVILLVQLYILFSVATGTDVIGIFNN
eukprot:CAMPEP_0195526128 /NCGR_PEP_ID=MMETSP0794_2-20130614/27024_1 /TAXON_ID=515487 /ORGANISM="Stephanopyxis turris, Strain CCMP 815" /LENGTH=122 /DNA_ID=CAMNT_0040656749 /DNA_START=175 /DNA_END=543 /DNA_ORIENTATION=+